VFSKNSKPEGTRAYGKYTPCFTLAASSFLRQYTNSYEEPRLDCVMKNVKRDIVIIIVNWNTKEMLKDCLYSIMQTKGNLRLQIIVVDNASSDGSSEMVQNLFPEVQLINSGGNIGFARANNLAIAHSDAPFILFLNPDTLVSENSINSMVDFLRSNPSIGALGCKMKDDKGRVQPLGLQWFPSPLTELFNILFVSAKTIEKIKKYLPYKDPDQSGYVSKLYGGCLVVRRDVLEQVGYFDERFFMYGEDVDLCKRIINGGWKLYYLSEAEVIHLVGGASRKTSDQFSTLMKCESISKLMQKYYGDKGKIFYRIVVFGGSIVRLSTLLILKSVSYFSFIGRNIKYEKSYSKYIAMIKWSLDLQKPIIKDSRN